MARLEIPDVRFRVRRLGLLRDTTYGWASIASAAAVSGAVATLATLLPSRLGGALFYIPIGVTIVALLVSLTCALPLLLLVLAEAILGVLARSRVGVVTVAEGALQIEAEALVLRCEPNSVRCVERGASGEVALVTHGGDRVRLELREPDAERFVAALLEPPSAAAWSFPLEAEARSPLPAVASFIYLPLLAVVANRLGGSSSAVVVGALALGLFGFGGFWVLRAFRGAVGRLSVGADGLAIRTDWRDRFVPYTSLEAVTQTDAGVRLWLTSGDHLDVSITRARLPPSAAAFAAARAFALVRYIGQRKAEATPVADDERLLRNGRRLDVWRSAVRSLVRDDAASYRASPLSPVQATSILAAPGSRPEARVGAALALASVADEATRAHVRICVEDLADDTTRAAVIEAMEDRLEPWRVELVEAAGRSR